MDESEYEEESCMRTRLSMMRNRRRGRRGYDGEPEYEDEEKYEEEPEYDDEGSATGNRNMRMSGKMMSRIDEEAV